MSIAARALAAMMPPEPLVPASYPLGRAWYVFRSNIKCEFKAEAGIKALGFEPFIPRERKSVIRRRRKVILESPLFTGYGFVKFDVEREDWGNIKSVDGVDDILKNNDLPVRVPSHEIDKIKLAEKFGLFDRTKKPMPFNQGDDVEIGEGPFSGFIGKVMRARSGDRVDILLDFFGSTREIVIPLLHIRENRI